MYIVISIKCMTEWVNKGGEINIFQAAVKWFSFICKLVSWCKFRYKQNYKTQIKFGYISELIYPSQFWRLTAINKQKSAIWRCTMGADISNYFAMKSIHTKNILLYVSVTVSKHVTGERYVFIWFPINEYGIYMKCR
jgi:hypothetical protein